MTAARIPRVAVLVLNHRGLELTRECLRSLAAVTYPAMHTFVLDNGSPVDESIPLRAEFGATVDVRRGETALGFCGGNNVLMRAALDAGYDYLLLLNNDTTVEPDFLEPLVRLMEEDRGIGAVGPRIMNSFDRAKLDSVGGELVLWRATHRHFPRAYPLPRTDLTFLTGCAFMLRREVAEQVGMLDPDYYAYWEEGDLCLRMRRAGWRIACEPRAVIYHKQSQTNRHLSNVYFYYQIRNGFLCMRKNGRAWEWPSFLVCFFTTTIAKYAGYLALRRPRDLVVVGQALSDAWHGRFGRRDPPPRPRA